MKYALAVAALAGTAMGFANSAHADTTYDWNTNNSGANGSTWSASGTGTANAWNVLPTGAATTALVFTDNSTGTFNTSVTAAFSFDTITFAGASSGTINIGSSGSGELVVGGGASDSILVNNLSGITNIYAGISLPATLTLGSSATETNGAALLNISGVIAGSGAIVMSGDVGVNFDATNTYTGGTSVSAGRLNGTASNAFGTGAVTISGGGETYLASGTFGENFSIAGTGSSAVDGQARGALRIDGGSNVAGTVTVTAIAQIDDNSGGGTISGAISNASSFALTIDGNSSDNGAIVLTNDSDQVGQLTIAHGTLQVGAGSTGNITQALSIVDSGSLIFDTSDTGANATYAMNISGSGAITQEGGNTITLSGTNTYKGNTTLTNNSTLKLIGFSSLGTTGTVSIASGSVLSLSESVNGSITSTTTATTFTGAGKILDNNGSNYINMWGVYTGFTGTLEIGSGTATWGAGTIASSTATIQVDSGAQVLLQAAGTFGQSFVLNGGTPTNTFAPTDGNLYFQTTGYTVTGGVTLNTGTSQIFATTSDTISGIVSGSGSMQLVGGTLALTNSNTYTGTTNINSGTTLQIGAGGTAGSISGSSSIVDSGALVYDLSSAVNFSSSKVISGSGSLTVEGGMTLQFTAPQTYTGDTDIVSGTLDMSTRDGSLSNLTDVVISSGGTLGVNGGGGAYPSGTLEIGSLSGSGTVTTNTSGDTLITGYDSASTIFSGLISGGANLSIGKTGSGTLTLSGNNTYAGTTTIYQGTLQLGNGTLSTGSITGSGSIVDSGALVFDTPSAGFTYNHAISGSGTLTLEANGEITLFGADSYTGATTISAGRVDIAVNASFGGSVVTISGSSTTTSGTGGEALFAVANVTVANNFSISGFGGYYNDTNLYGSIRLGTAADAITGTVTLTGNSGIAIETADTGTIFGNISALANTDNLTINNGTQTGTLILTANNTLNSGLTIVQGTLQLGNGSLTTGSISSASSIVDSGTLVFDTATNGFTYSQVISGVGAVKQCGTDTITLIANETYTGTTTIQNAGGTLQLGSGGTAGSITGSGSIVDSGSLVFDVATNGFTYGHAISGSGSITQSGSDTITLSGANSYTGGLTALAGTVNLFGSQTGATGGISLNGGTVVAESTAILAPSSIQVGTGASETSTFTINSGANISIGSGGVQIGNTVSVGSDAELLTSAGNVTNSGTLVVGRAGGAGNGGLTLTGGTWTQNGALTVEGLGGFGTVLTVSGGATFTYASNSAITMNGAGTNSAGAGDLNVEGTATFVTGANFSLTGTASETGIFLIGGGTLQLSKTIASDLFGAVPVSLSSGNGTINVTSYTAFTSTVISGPGNLVLAGTTGTLTLDGDNTYTGTTTVNAGVTLQLGSGGAAGSISVSDGIIDSGTLTFDTASTNYNYSYSITGSGALTQSGSDTITLSGSNTVSGQTNANAGTLDLANTNALQNSILNMNGGAVTFDASVVANAFNIAGLTGSTNLSLLNTTGNAINLTLTNASTTYAGVLSDGGLGSSLTIAAGTQTLTANNSYTGATTLGAGAMLMLGSGGASGSISNSSSIVDNGTLVFNSTTAGLVYSNPISGSGGITQYGSGYTILQADNSFTGVTTIGGAALQIGSGTAGGITGSSSIVDNNALNFQTTDTGANATYSSAISGYGSVSLTSSTITLAGNNSYTGATTIDGASTLQIGNGAASGNITNSSGITDNGALIFDNTSATGQTYNNPISGSGSLAVNAGTVTLAYQAETLTGAVTVASGATLALANTNNGSPSGLYEVSSLTLGGTVVTDSDNALFGYNDPHTPALTINSGGVLTNLASADGGTGTSVQILSLITMNGGTLATNGSLTATNTAVTGLGQSEYGSWELYGGINVTANSTISAQQVVAVQSGGLQINIATGDTLNVSGSFITPLGLSDTGIILNPTAGKAGTLLFTGASTYTAATTIDAGTVQIGNGGSTGSITSTSNITNNGALVFNTSASSTYGMVISGSGSVTQSGTGTITLSNTETYTGTTTISSGTINLTGKLGDTAVTVNNGATLAAAATTSLGATSGTSLTLLSGSTLNLADGTVGNFTINNSAGSYSGTALSLQGATIDMDLGNSSVDQLVVANGNAVISGTNTINFSTTGDTSLTDGTYTILNVENGTKSASPVFEFANHSTKEAINVGGTYYTLSLVDPSGSEMLDIGSASQSIITLSAAGAGTPTGFTSGQQILNHGTPTTAYQGVFSTGTSALTVTGSNGNYAFKTATHINSQGTGNTNSNQGNTTAYIEINGFNPANDEEIAALGIDDNGSLLTATPDGASISTTSIASDINTYWDASGQSGTIAYVLAGSQYAGVFGTTQYNVYLDFTAGQLANLGLSSSGDNYLAFDFTADPIFNGTSADLTVTAVAVVPEPSSLGLLGLGVMGLAAGRRRRRKNRKV